MMLKIPNRVIVDSDLYELRIRYCNVDKPANPVFEWKMGYYYTDPFGNERILVSMRGKNFADVENSMLSYLSNNKIETE